MLCRHCQAWGRWVEVEERLAAGPARLKTPAGYVQPSPWLSIANKQMELMGRDMTELGLTPAARSRIAACLQPPPARTITRIRIVGVRADQAHDEDGERTALLRVGPGAIGAGTRTST